MPDTIARVLDRALADRPDAEAVVARSGRLTYRELDAAADRAAAAFAALGLATGDHVAACLGKDVGGVVACHGAMRRGLVWVGLNAALTGTEKAQLLDDSRARLLLTDVGTAADVAAAGQQLPALDHVRCVDRPAGDDSWPQLLTTTPAAS